MMEVASTIRGGTALLDQTYPEWYKHISVDRLDLSESYSCVLGQLGPKDYFYNRLRFGVDNDNEVALGFNVTGYVDETAEAFESLTRRWKAAIRRRLRRDGL